MIQPFLFEQYFGFASSNLEYKTVRARLPAGFQENIGIQIWVDMKFYGWDKCLMSCHGRTIVSSRFEFGIAGIITSWKIRQAHLLIAEFDRILR